MTTITREQFEAAWAKFRDTDQVPMAAFGIVLKDLGITIAEPEPPASMVRLAREIVLRMPRSFSDIEDDAAEQAALAALQHAAKVVRDAPYTNIPPGPVVNLYHILRQLGAEQ